MADNQENPFAEFGGKIVGKASKAVSTNDFSEFGGKVIGSVEKKNGGTEYSLTQLKSSLPKDRILDDSFLGKVGKNISATTTPMGITELPIKEIKETEISLKPKKEAKQYYNAPLEKGLLFKNKEGKLSPELEKPTSRALTGKIEKAPEIDLKKSTQKDLVEQAREMPIAEPEPERSWWNVGQNFADNMFITVADLLESGALAMRDAGTGEDWTAEPLPKLFEGGKPTKEAKSLSWTKDPFGKIALGLHGIKRAGEMDLEYNRLPDTMVGKIIEGGLGLAPDILLSEAMPQAAISSTATKAEKFGKLIFNNFTKYLAGKKASQEYNKAIEEGKNDTDAKLSALKGGAIGTGEGILYALAGAGSNYMTKASMKELEKVVGGGFKGMATKEAINIATDGIMYGAAVPTVQNAVQGKLPTEDEIAQGVGMSLLFSAKRILSNAKTNAELEKALDQVKGIKQTVALQNFLDATPESILEVNKNKESANDLSLKAIEASKKARETTDLDLKNKYVGEAMLYTKAANVKQVSDIILNNGNIDKVVAESDMPDSVKETFIAKANEIYKQLHPDEINKRTFGDNIQGAEAEIKELEKTLNASTDPVEKAEINNRINKLKADVEANYAELDKIIEKQNAEKEKANEVETVKEPEVIETVRETAIEPEMPEGGVTIVTETGLTEPERQYKIEQRQKETKVSDEVISRNQLVQEVKEFFDKGKRYRNSSEGLKKLNELRIKAREKGLEVDDKSEALVKKTGARKTKIKYNAKAEGDAVIDQSGKTLYDRDKNVQDIFKELLDVNGFIDIKREDGVRMSEAQIDATIQDILDGIPSKRANRYLDELETAIKDDAFNVYDKGLGKSQFTLQEIRDALGVEAEKVGEPMDEESLIKFLDEESNLSPEEERELTDNIENLLYEYEPETGAKVEIQQTKPESKEGIPTEAKQAEGAKETTAEQPAEPVEAPKEKEAPKEVTLKDLYESLPKSEKLRKEAINDNIDQIISKLVTENKIKKEC